MDLHGGFWDWVSGLDLNTLGFVIVGLFVGVWLIALLAWRWIRFEEKAAPHDASTER
jgi:high-affinity nickel-transport protein